MPIQHSKIECGDLCNARQWIVNDPVKLARSVGFTLSGAHSYAIKIIDEKIALAPRRIQAVKAAIGQIYLDPIIENDENNPDVWARDGLLFQAISWVAAHKALPPGAILANPHVIKSHKGFDGLQITIHNGEAILTVFEDKAGNPDRLIEKITAEFQQMEEDDTYKATEILSFTTAMLIEHKIDEDAYAEQLLWLKNRHYRASLAVLDRHVTPDGAAKLFRKYAQVVKGDVRRRSGELMASPGVRAYFRGFAAQVVSELEDYLTLQGQ